MLSVWQSTILAVSSGAPIGGPVYQRRNCRVAAHVADSGHLTSQIRDVPGALAKQILDTSWQSFDIAMHKVSIGLTKLGFT